MAIKFSQPSPFSPQTLYNIDSKPNEGKQSIPKITNNLNIMSSKLYNAALIQHVREVLNLQPTRSPDVIQLQTNFNESGQMQFSQSVTRRYSCYWSDDDSDDYDDDYPSHPRGPQRNGTLKKLVEHLSKIRGFNRTEFPNVLQTSLLNLKKEERSRAIVLAKLIAENPESIIWASEEEVEKKIDEASEIVDVVTEDLADLAVE